MRLFFLVALACAFVASAIDRVDAAPTASLDLTASHVAYYADRFVLVGDGSVRLHLSDGTVIRGESFAMDLKQDRYLVAGDVRIDGPGVHEVGAAFSNFIDADRSYFLSASGTPDRWTYFGLDWADRHPGRQQPGDAFAFPDTGTGRPYIVASGARVIPQTNVLFDNARILTAGVYIPTPRYVVTISANPNFYQNAFAGGRFDIGEPYNGSAHSLSAFHLRNDPVNGTYLSFDQHFVWNQDYIVASVNPLTQEQRQWNFIGYKRVSPGLEVRGFFQLNTQSFGPLSLPLDSGSFANIQVNGALPHSGFSFSVNQYNWYLLAIQPGDTYIHRRSHPIDMSFSWTGLQQHFGKSPLAYQFKYQLRSGMGYAHDQYGEGYYPSDAQQELLNGGFGPPDLWYHFVGASLIAPTLRFKNQMALSFTADKQRTWYSEPHHVDVTSGTASLSRAFDFNKINTYLAYSLTETADYWGADQLQAYPAGMINGIQYPDTYTVPGFGTYSGLDAFRGLAVTRNYTLGIIYTPTSYFNVAVTARRFYDTPAPIPGLYGQPPWQLTTDIRARLARQVQVDVARTYYFNFANLRWQPQFQINFSP
ncbi:MAG TPA: hypothetical protein VMA36_21785 [Candidatus Limnocylindria bacterium]|nr:hypothetical protein [Candidatus Limnocylindria bacterium]